MNGRQYRMSQAGLFCKRQKIGKAYLSMIVKEENSRRRLNKILYWLKIYCFLASCFVLGCVITIVDIYFRGP